MSELKVTSLVQLEKYAEGQVVEFPPFADGQPFVARVKRPSMLALMKSGKIPNSLLKTANGLFAGKVATQDESADIDKIFDVLDCIAEACFIEPSYDQIKASGIELSDDQYMFIFNYTQRGVKALETFRQQHGDLELGSTVKAVPKKAK